MDISGVKGMTYSQMLIYKQNWDTFNRIQLFNSNVSTQINSGASGLQYYNYANYSEKNMFIQGQLLHIQSQPYYSTLWYSVEKNYK